SAQDGFVVWTATGAQPAPTIATVLTRPGVHAVALAPAGADPRYVDAALQLAGRLTNETQPDQPTRARVTSPHPPERTGVLIPVPHLVTMRTTPAGVTPDTAICDLLPADEP